MYHLSMSIPRILRDENDIARWSERREEILSLFKENLFGFTPEMNFDDISCVELEHLVLEKGLERKLFGLCFTKGEESCGLRFTVTYDSSSMGSLPIILHINPFSLNARIYSHKGFSFSQGGIFPTQRIAKSGYVAVDCFVDEIRPDSPVVGTNDIMAIYPPEKGNGWCTISAWAWAAYRVALALPSCGFPSRQITVCGFSRGAKTALWCGAQYPIFTSVYSCEAGCCGSAIFRGKQGETIEAITRRYPYWSCDNFKKYVDREEDLPFDQHMLLALIAPRPLCVSSAREDLWSDPKKEFESCVLVSELYEALGYKGIGGNAFPKDDKPVRGDRLQYHVRSGDHDCNSYDWDCVLEFLFQFPTQLNWA